MMSKDLKDIEHAFHSGELDIDEALESAYNYGMLECWQMGVRPF